MYILLLVCLFFGVYAQTPSPTASPTETKAKELPCNSNINLNEAIWSPSENIQFAWSADKRLVITNGDKSEIYGQVHGPCDPGDNIAAMSIFCDGSIWAQCYFSEDFPTWVNTASGTGPYTLELSDDGVLTYTDSVGVVVYQFSVSSPVPAVTPRPTMSPTTPIPSTSPTPPTIHPTASPTAPINKELPCTSFIDYENPSKDLWSPSENIKLTFVDPGKFLVIASADESETYGTLGLCGNAAAPRYLSFGCDGSIRFNCNVNIETFNPAEGTGPYKAELSDSGNLTYTDSLGFVVWQFNANLTVPDVTSRPTHSPTTPTLPVPTQSPTSPTLVPTTSPTLFRNKSLSCGSAVDYDNVANDLWSPDENVKLTFVDPGKYLVLASADKSETYGTIGGCGSFAAPRKIEFNCDGSVLFRCSAQTTTLNAAEGTAPYTAELSNEGLLTYTDATDTIIWQFNAAVPVPTPTPSTSVPTGSPLEVPCMDVVDTCAGTYFTAILYSDNTVRAFGYEQWGLLTSLTTIEDGRVFDISPETPKAVHCSAEQLYIESTAGKLYGIGYNGNGALGVNVSVGNSVSTLMPITIGDDESVKLLATQSHTTCVLTTINNFYCWGNTAGLTVHGPSPVRFYLGGADQVKKVLVSGSNRGVLYNNGTIQMWGTYEILLGNTVSNEPNNQTLPLDFLVKDAFVGYQYIVLHLVDDRVLTYGFNAFGVLGLDEPTHTQIDYDVNNIVDFGGTPVKKLFHIDGGVTCAEFYNRSISCFGANHRYLLNTGDNNYDPTPKPPMDYNNTSLHPKKMSGYLHMVVQFENNGIKTWGLCQHNQCGYYQYDFIHLKHPPEEFVCFGPTNAPTTNPTDVPSESPTNAPTLNPFQGIYTYVGEGTCMHTPGNWNLDYAYIQGAGINSDHECAVRCYEFETCIGFANYDGNQECRCYFDNDFRTVPQSGISGFVDGTNGNYPITHSSGAPGMTCYKFENINWGPTNAPSPNPSRAPTGSPIIEPTSSPTVAVYEHLGQGKCQDANNNIYDLSYLLGTYTVDECSDHCKSLPTSIGFGLTPDGENWADCECYFDDVNRDVPSPPDVTAFIDIHSGRYPIVSNNMVMGRHCFRFVSVYWGPTPSPTPPTVEPTANPTRTPTLVPSDSPSVTPTTSPTGSPSVSPSQHPSASPTTNPSESPSTNPTVAPSANPSASPTVSPSNSPSASPSVSPTGSPTAYTPIVLSYSEDFVGGEVVTNTDQQCTNLEAVIDSIDENTVYSYIKLYGSGNPTGYECSGSVANDIVQALRTWTPGPGEDVFMCGSNDWHVGTCSNTDPSKAPEISVNYPNCFCFDGVSGATLRPCQEGSVWGGIGYPTCDSVSQTMALDISTDAPTALPTTSPTNFPSKSPTYTGQTYSPTGSPSGSPTVSPTNTPTTSPTSSSLVYSYDFSGTSGPGGAQCDGWYDFIKSINPSYTYNYMRITGSLAVWNFECTGTEANDFAQKMRELYYNQWPPSYQAYGVSCGGFIWRLDNTSTTWGQLAPEVTVNTALGDCHTTPYNFKATIRPCIGNDNWGGVSTASCFSPPQRMEMYIQLQPPTVAPTNAPTLPPTNPTTEPTSEPTNNPTVSPTNSPSTNPTVSPSKQPSISPTDSPSASPSISPTESPSNNPTVSPSKHPSTSPSGSPSISPSMSPSTSPTNTPSNTPTVDPTTNPSASPSTNPTVTPSYSPTVSPSDSPSTTPSVSPSLSPSTNPTANPSASPSVSPTPPTNEPTLSPTYSPTHSPVSTGNMDYIAGSRPCRKDSSELLMSILVKAQQDCLDDCASTDECVAVEYQLSNSTCFAYRHCGIQSTFKDGSDLLLYVDKYRFNLWSRASVLSDATSGQIINVTHDITSVQCGQMCVDTEFCNYYTYTFVNEANKSCKMYYDIFGISYSMTNQNSMMFYAFNNTLITRSPTPPTSTPTGSPSGSPTLSPTDTPSSSPTGSPSVSPSISPSASPTPRATQLTDSYLDRQIYLDTNWGFVMNVTLKAVISDWGNIMEIHRASDGKVLFELFLAANGRYPYMRSFTTNQGSSHDLVNNGMQFVLDQKIELRCEFRNEYKKCWMDGVQYDQDITPLSTQWHSGLTNVYVAGPLSTPAKVFVDDLDVFNLTSIEDDGWYVPVYNRQVSGVTYNITTRGWKVDFQFKMITPIAGDTNILEIGQNVNTRSMAFYILASSGKLRFSTEFTTGYIECDSTISVNTENMVYNVTGYILGRIQKLYINGDLVCSQMGRYDTYELKGSPQPIYISMNTHTAAKVLTTLPVIEEQAIPLQPIENTQWGTWNVTRDWKIEMWVTRWQRDGAITAAEIFRVGAGQTRPRAVLLANGGFEMGGDLNSGTTYQGTNTGANGHYIPYATPTKLTAVYKDHMLNLYINDVPGAQYFNYYYRYNDENEAPKAVYATYSSSFPAQLEIHNYSFTGLKSELQCPDGYYRFSKNCIRYYPEPLKWDNAQQVCEQDGAHLWTPKHWDADMEMLSLFDSPSAQIWLGLRRVGTTSSYYWIDNEYYGQYTKTIASATVVNNQCVSMLTWPGIISDQVVWYPDLCEKPHPFMCQFDVFMETRTVDLPGSPVFVDKSTLCPAGYTMHKGACMKFVTSFATYDVAAQDCALEGATHAIGNLESRFHILWGFEPYLLNRLEIWLGLRQQIGNNGFPWMWADGSEYRYYSRWRENEPNSGSESCGHQYTDASWNDVSCSGSLRYVCIKNMAKSVSPTPSPTNSPLVGGATHAPTVANSICPGVIGSGWEVYDGDCHLFVRSETNFPTADAACISYGGFLVTIENEEKSDWIRSMMSKYLFYRWAIIGLYRGDERDSWKWIETRAPPMYSNWIYGEPNGADKATVIYPATGLWYGITKSETTFHYICQVPPSSAPTASPSRSPTGTGETWSPTTSPTEIQLIQENTIWDTVYLPGGYWFEIDVSYYGTETGWSNVFDVTDSPPITGGYPRYSSMFLADGTLTPRFLVGTVGGGESHCDSSIAPVIGKKHTYRGVVDYFQMRIFMDGDLACYVNIGTAINYMTAPKPAYVSLPVSTGHLPSKVKVHRLEFHNRTIQLTPNTVDRMVYVPGNFYYDLNITFHHYHPTIWTNVFTLGSDTMRYASLYINPNSYLRHFAVTSTTGQIECDINDNMNLETPTLYRVYVEDSIMTIYKNGIYACGHRHGQVPRRMTTAQPLYTSSPTYAGAYVTINSIEFYNMTAAPSLSPTASPTSSPTVSPTLNPTTNPTVSPTNNPTASPTTQYPTKAPVVSPNVTGYWDVYLDTLCVGTPANIVLKLPENEWTDTMVTSDVSECQTICREHYPECNTFLYENGTDTCSFQYIGGSSISFSSDAHDCYRFSTPSPTRSPSVSPTQSPSQSPTTQAPSQSPTTASPSISPTDAPTASPTPPTLSPTNSPSVSPTDEPTASPTPPTKSPTDSPTASPTPPTPAPTNSPSTSPTRGPTSTPTISPTGSPTEFPCLDGTWVLVENWCFKINTTRTTWQGAKTQCESMGYEMLTLENPAKRAAFDSVHEGGSDTWIGLRIDSLDEGWYWLNELAVYDHPNNTNWNSVSEPTVSAGVLPRCGYVRTFTNQTTWGLWGCNTGNGYVACQYNLTPWPTSSPTGSPTVSPTMTPTNTPTVSPSDSPSLSPTNSPSISPTTSPSDSPSVSPTNSPSTNPTLSPSDSPSVSPTNAPSTNPTTSPSIGPSVSPTSSPSNNPTSSPSDSPSISPTVSPSTSPSVSPSSSPSVNPTLSPTDSPSNNPTLTPTIAPTEKCPGYYNHYTKDGTGTGWPFCNSPCPVCNAGDEPTSGCYCRYNCGNIFACDINAINCQHCVETARPTRNPTTSPSGSPSMAPTRYRACTVAGFDNFDQHCYKYVTTPLSFQNASDHCKDLHPLAELVSIGYEQENDMLLNEYGSPIWIGLREVNNTWEWLNGDQLVYTNWDHENTTETCAGFINGSRWWDYDCNTTMNFVCKISGSVSPSASPTGSPTNAPSDAPTMSPTDAPTAAPTPFCAPGTHLASNGTCVYCQPGYYSAVANNYECYPCYGGTFSNETGATECTLCEIGYFQPYKAMTQCFLCPMDYDTTHRGSRRCDITFAPTMSPTVAAGAVGAAEASAECVAGSYINGTDCIPCHPGTYTSSPNSVECFDCIPGTYASEHEATSCTPCSVGYFSSTNGNTQCTQCPDGTTTPGTGATQCKSTTKCPAGWVDANDCCYHLDTSTVRNWQDSYAACVTIDSRARMAILETATKEHQLFETYGTNLPFWIGLFRPSKLTQFDWVDGTELIYSKWLDGSHPTDGDRENCVVRTPTGWDNIDCSAKRYTMCEMCGFGTERPTSTPPPTNKIKTHGYDQHPGRTCGIVKFANIIYQPDIEKRVNFADSINDVSSCKQYCSSNYPVCRAFEYNVFSKTCYFAEVHSERSTIADAAVSCYIVQSEPTDDTPEAVPGTDAPTSEPAHTTSVTIIWGTSAGVGGFIFLGLGVFLVYRCTRTPVRKQEGRKLRL